MKGASLLLLPAILLLGAAGCAPNADDGVDEAAVAKEQEPFVTAAKAAGGEWDRLSAEDQKLFLDKARGNLNAAKQMVAFMGSRVNPGAKAKP